MNIMLEALRELKEAKKTGRYPTKCGSFAYRLLTNSQKLISGSFVTFPRLKYPTLGVNINYQWYGAGSMANARKALSFLNEEDAKAFCDKYNVTDCYTYISKNYETLIRIDNNTDVPTYMLEDTVSFAEDKLNTVQKANLNSQPQSADNVVSDEIKQKNDARKQAIDTSATLTEVAKEVTRYVNNLPTVNIKPAADADDIHIKFKLSREHSSDLNPKFELQFNLSGKSIPLPENEWDSLAIVLNSPKLEHTMGATIQRTIINEYHDKFNRTQGYDYSFSLNSTMFDLQFRYDDTLQYALTHNVTIYHVELLKLYNRLATADAIKQKLKEQIDKNLPSVIADIKTGFELKTELEKMLEDSGATKKVELGYNDF